MRRKTILAIAFTTLLLGYATSTLATPVFPDDDPAFGLTDLGFFAAGSYDITATGIISLAGPVGGGGSQNFDLDPDGIPVGPMGVTYPTYLYFNPTGSTLADGNPGPAGPTINVGALVGSLTATPMTADYFLIGSGTTINLLAGQNIYAAVNDTFYPNNTGSFEVTVNRANPAPAPAPASWALLTLGLAGLRLTRRGKRD